MHVIKIEDDLDGYQKKKLPFTLTEKKYPENQVSECKVMKKCFNKMNRFVLQLFLGCIFFYM